MGRRSNAENARLAAEQASQAAQQVQTTPVEPTAPESARDESVRLPPRNEPRRLAMEELVARNERAGKGEEEPPAPELPPDPVPPTAQEILDANTPKPEGETPAAPAPVQEVQVKTVKVKVDGQESEVPQAEIEEAGGVAAYQRDKASENRLAAANKALAETRQLHAQISQFAQSIQQPKAPVITDDEFIKSKVDTIRFGTPEESAAALRDVMTRSNPKVDANAITQQAVNAIRRNLAVDTFKKEFQDVVSNPNLLGYASWLETQTPPEQNQDWDLYYRNIGNKAMNVVRAQHQPQAATPVTGTTSQVSDKEARKASIVNLPTAAARASLPEEKKPETRADILNQMRKSRGIPTG